ncbi:ABC transporter ATP-binding protein [Paenibacillus chungangensis]|uniref:ABC transporter ATP-binding protein n=1 Tax=Paenibacillus chungangensis TaxID=696535 RepID=A0ABW3HTK9_9BACL
MNEELALRFEGIEHRRTTFRLGPLSLDIPKGYITAIVGPNGSGKSSLFRLALNLTQPDSGSLTMLGEKVGKYPDEYMKQRIGYLSEDSSSHDDSIRGNSKAEFHSFWYRNWDVNLYQELLQVFKIHDHQPLSKMSKGMRRKFEFTLAMAHHPELLLLDEPSSGLDPLAWKSMIEVLHRYMDQGDRTILMATHIVEEVRRLADYIVFIVQGQVLGVYEKDELFSSWMNLYVSCERASHKSLENMPGQCAIEHAGGTTYRVTTDRAMEAEQWCRQEDVAIVSRGSMELDDILAVLMEQSGFGIRAYEARGHGK